MESGGLGGKHWWLRELFNCFPSVIALMKLQQKNLAFEEDFDRIKFSDIFRNIFRKGFCKNFPD